MFDKSAFILGFMSLSLVGCNKNRIGKELRPDNSIKKDTTNQQKEKSIGKKNDVKNERKPTIDTNPVTEKLLGKCNLGEMKLCAQLGYIYEKGLNVSINYREANRLYQKACDGGHMSGCFNLALMYRKGEGVAQDKSKAVGLFQKACDGGHKEACAFLKKIKPK